MERDCTRLLSFYRGSGTDHRGRHIADVLRFSPAELEENHDYIQWLFPLDAPSGVLPGAPIVDQECRRAFAADAALRATLRSALGAMLVFYGFELLGDGSSPRIERDPDFTSRAANWLTRGNHNFLRLTRIVRSLGLLGERALANALLECLEGVYREHVDVIGSRTIGYWRDALHGLE